MTNKMIPWVQNHAKCQKAIRLYYQYEWLKKHGAYIRVSLEDSLIKENRLESKRMIGIKESIYRRLQFVRKEENQMNKYETKRVS